jgi:hypothetical protein
MASPAVSRTDLKGHVWLSVGGEVVIGGSVAGDFTLVGSFPAEAGEPLKPSWSGCSPVRSGSAGRIVQKQEASHLQPDAA